VVNFEQQFEDQVVKPFIDDYLAGRTPIPCTLCNNYIKFDRFLEMAEGVGAEHIATGHYARIRRDENSGRWLLLRGVDAAKDQTYFLFGLTQQQLSRTLFPLGEMEKGAVRELARRLQVPVAEKEDSQEICFVPDGDYAGFIDAWFREKGVAAPELGGEVVNTSGRVLGTHAGVHRYTVGQRKGLGIASGEPLYVISTEPLSRKVVVGTGDELLRSSLAARQVNWISIPRLDAPRRVEVKIRNKHLAASATMLPTPDPTQVEVRFDTRQRAVTPGQAAVFYEGELVLGGGWIE
jgi:tRNA-specific 2-thiouridylase